jgi:uncharacterized protein involved in exopolysaccharide biosynthesis
LKVKKPKDEKVLEINVTLEDKVKAQKLAEYISQQTIAINRSLERHSMGDLSRDVTNFVDAAQTRLQNARAARQSFLTEQPMGALEAELTSATDLKARADRNLADGEVELSATQARIASQARDTAATASASREDVAAIEAQVSTLRQQSHALGQRVAEDSAQLEQRRQQREVLDKELQSAQTQYEAAVTRRTEILSSEAFRGERLEIIDPGVVPERPSSPDIPLNLAVAFLASVFCSVVYLAFRFAYARSEPVYR